MGVSWVWRHSMLCVHLTDCTSCPFLFIVCSRRTAFLPSSPISILISFDLHRPPVGALIRLETSVSLISSPYPFIPHSTWSLRLQTMFLCYLAIFFPLLLRVVLPLRNLASLNSRARSKYLLVCILFDASRLNPSGTSNRAYSALVTS
jgi:hypothetical protein